jgi:hypothetical protein
VGYGFRDIPHQWRHCDGGSSEKRRGKWAERMKEVDRPCF